MAGHSKAPNTTTPPSSDRPEKTEMSPSVWPTWALFKAPNTHKLFPAKNDPDRTRDNKAKQETPPQPPTSGDHPQPPIHPHPKPYHKSAALPPRPTGSKDTEKGRDQRPTQKAALGPPTPESKPPQQSPKTQPPKNRGGRENKKTASPKRGILVAFYDTPFS